jgi:ABC-type lipoprotein release transport system permease subunit
MIQAIRVAWYRFRAGFHRRWTGYLSIVLLIGSVGGVAMASIAGARRTDTSFQKFLESTNPSDLAVITGLYQPDPTGYDPGFIKKISRLPYVTRVESEAGYSAEKVSPKGRPVQGGMSSGSGGVSLYSSVDGFFFNMDRLVVLSGRLPNPARAHEVAVTADAARSLGLHLGSTFPLGVSGDKQSNTCQECIPTFRTVVTVVGIVTTGTGLVIDDTDRSPEMFATPAFTKPLLKCCSDPTISFLQIAGGSSHLATVEAEISRILPKGLPQLLTPTSSRAEATAQRVIRPEAIALGTFGLIVSLVTLIIALQLLGRQLRLGADEREVVRALGGTPAMTSLDGLIGVVGAVIAGSVLAGVVALLLSPLAPIGPVRPVYPTPGLAFDGVVLGIGVLSMVVLLTGIAVAISIYRAPHRVARRGARRETRASKSVRTAMVVGLPAPAVCGIRFALVPGDGRQASPVRSAVVGAVVAVSVVVATLTFGSSLNTLVSRPALYGWNWTVLMSAAGGVGVMPEKAMKKELNGDPDVVAWSGVDFGQLQIDGTHVSVLAETPGAHVTPPILSGHDLDGPGQVVLGTQTLAQLHKHVGSTVEVSVGTGKSTTLRVVGTATFPAVGGTQHTELGSGALLDFRLIPKSERNIFNLPGGGPNAVLIRLKAPTKAAALDRLHKMVPILEKADQDQVGFIGVQRPAEVANAGTLRATPAYLAFALAGAAVAALGLTLIASVRRRRRDLALLKALGFTQRQLAAAVAWQATVAAVIGLVVGVPVGALTGRWLWTLFARSINVVPEPTVPIIPLVLVVVGALLFANLVALLPGRSAARTSAALVLRAE